MQLAQQLPGLARELGAAGWRRAWEPLLRREPEVVDDRLALCGAQAAEAARRREPSDPVGEIPFVAVDLQDVVAQPQSGTPARPVLEQGQFSAIDRDVGAAGDEPFAQGRRRLGQGGHIDVEREPLQEGMGVGVVEQRPHGRRAACDHGDARVVDRICGVERQVVLRRGHRDGVLLGPVDVDGVVDTQVLARPIADVTHVDRSERSVATQRAGKRERHRLGIEQHGDLRQTLVGRDRHAHVLGAPVRHEISAVSAQRTRSSTCSGQLSRKTRNGIDARRSSTQVRYHGTPAGCRP